LNPSHIIDIVTNGSLCHKRPLGQVFSFHLRVFNKQI